MATETASELCHLDVGSISMRYAASPLTRRPHTASEQVLNRRLGGHRSGTGPHSASSFRSGFLDLHNALLKC